MPFRLKDVTIDSSGSFGGKAAALGTLINDGVRVPEGYVLPAAAMEEFLEYNGFRYSTIEYLSHNDEIQLFIKNGKMPARLAVQLEEIYSLLAEEGCACFSVRSSAFCEDTKAYSMAGAYSSYLKFEAFDELLDAVKGCFASLFSSRALALSVRNGISPDNLKMGVIIQQFIEGELSGVIFTADAVGMDGNSIVINAVKGLCPGFVDGTASAAIYKVRKSDACIVDEHIAPNGPELPKAVIDMLLEASLHIENLFGSYQDIEWTIRNGELFILQARPVTGFRQNDTALEWLIPAEADSKTWELVDREPLQPLLQDVLFMHYSGITAGLIESGKGGGQSGQIVNGYAYSHFAPHDPERRKEFRKVLDELSAEGKNIFQDVVLPQLLQHKARLDGYIGRQLSNDELESFLQKSLEFFQKALELHILAVDGSIYLDDFKKFCIELIPELSENDIYDLLYNTTWLSRERISIAMMAEYVKADETLSKLFADELFDEILFAHLVRLDAGKALLNMFDMYMKDYGLIVVKEKSLYLSPVMLERPWVLVSKIRACMGMDTARLSRSVKEIIDRKERLRKQIYDRLDNCKAKEFTARLHTAEKAFLVNDDHCYYIDLTSQGYLRLAVIQTGRAFAEAGAISAGEDIFFMRVDEILRCLSGSSNDLKHVIEQRKCLYNSRRTAIPPEFLGLEPKREETGPEEGVSPGEIKLIGVSGLKKKVRGRIKVIKDNMKRVELEDNHILVLKHGHGCYFLPVMDKILGLVYDHGSPYDHPGIIAREFDIPSIYNTRNATEVLMDGDLAELDGVNGEVRVLQRA